MKLELTAGTGSVAAIVALLEPVAGAFPAESPAQSYANPSTSAIGCC